jgi:hypothetical protein
LAVALAIAFARPAAAQQSAAAQDVDQQAAFRAVLARYHAMADAESDLERVRALEPLRAGALAKVLGEGLRFADWRLVLGGTEPTPMGGIFLRFVDGAPDNPKSVRPTYWNSGPGAVMREVEIKPKSPLHGPVGLLKRGSTVTVSGHFFPDQHGGPMFESARIATQPLAVERAKFRMPYFSIKLTEIGEP